MKTPILTQSIDGKEATKQEHEWLRLGQYEGFVIGLIVMAIVLSIF